MLNKINRLTKKKDFDNIFNKGQSSFDGIIGIKKINSSLTSSRFGIMVSTKISKKAVERNLIKRQIRATIEEELLKLKDGFDCVIITLPTIKNKPYSKIQKSILTHFRKLNLYK